MLIIFLTYDIKNYGLSFINILTFYVAKRPKRPTPKVIRCFYVMMDVTSLLKFSVLTLLNVACELSQPMGKTISIFHVCMVWIEKSVTRVTDRHHEACRVMPNSDPE